jgi:ApbE superfamily uncharacterized protein (UPF0280 family)
MHQKRKYRNLVHREGLVPFRVVVKETDILVHAAKPLDEITRELVLRYRGYIESYIERYPEFAVTLMPWRINEPAPLIITDMAAAGARTGVGPMAAVAGVMAEYVGTALMTHPNGSNEVIVENGGDLFIKLAGPFTVGIYAGDSPLSMNIGLRIVSGNRPVSVCTSSGTIGHSLSLGNADAVSVVSESCALADAAATAIGNRVQSKSDINDAIDFGKTIQGVDGLVVIMGDKIGLWGKIEVVPLSL